MIARLVGRTLRGKIRPWNFSTEEKAEKRSAFMSEKDIRASLPDEELQTLENLVHEKQAELTENHRQRLAKVTATLSEVQRVRIEKIAGLMAKLNESQGEYVKHKLMASVQISKGK